MPDTRTERTRYLGLLALMIAGADSENWSYPYWNTKQIDAALAALADASRDGTVPLVAPVEAPTTAVSGTAGSLAGGVTLEIGQTFVDAYGRETNAGPLAVASTPAGITDPAVAPTLGAPTLGGLSGYEGGLLEVWFSWTDGAGGETLPSPLAQVDVPYQAGGLLSEVVVTLPSTPAVAEAAGANVYLRHRGGNVVLAYRILTGSVDEVTLTGAVADCYRSTSLANTTGSTNAIDITGEVGPTGAALTRFYVRNQGDAWAAADGRLKLAGMDEWDPATVVYPLLYTGATGQITAGFPPAVSQVKAIRPIDLSREVIGTLAAENLPEEAVSEAELVRSIGEGVLSGFAVTAQSVPNMTVHIATGEALLGAGRFLPMDVDLTIPTADNTHHRIDIIVLNSGGVIQGPTEDVALKGTPAPSPVAKATPAGALKLAEVNVANGATTIVTGAITDSRWVAPTLAAAVVELRGADAGVSGDLSDHILDETAHASKARTITDAETICDGSSTADFTITALGPMLVTRVKSVVSSAGVIDYKLELYSNAGRTVLEYQAGGDVGSGIGEGTFEDRIPWEWFGGATIYGRITNNSADALTAIAVGVKYRR